MPEINKEFQIFAKPIGALCNLDCEYCYYLDKLQLYPDKKSETMALDLLETYIVEHLEASTDNPVLFSWHGGEPTLAGLNFYKKVVEIQKKKKRPSIQIINGIQTNGTNINDEWCSFFAHEGFIVGISMDGTEELHNKYRVTKAGGTTFHKVLNAYQLLKKYQINTEILCVVNAFNVNYPLEVYNFFKSLETQYISFLPLVNRSFGTLSRVTPDSVNAKAFGDFLITIFDEWQEKDIGNIKIQLFEEALRTAFNMEHTLCVFKKTCGGVPVLEKNGDFYSCDHFVKKEYLVGNLKKSSLSDLLDSPKQIAFGQAKFKNLPKYCLDCEVLEMCNGECPKNRFIKTPDGEPGLNYLCEGYRKFFNHCRPLVEAIATVFKNQA